MWAFLYLFLFKYKRTFLICIFFIWYLKLTNVLTIINRVYFHYKKWGKHRLKSEPRISAVNSKHMIEKIIHY